jgi:hypothetical protein
MVGTERQKGTGIEIKNSLKPSCVIYFNIESLPKSVNGIFNGNSFLLFTNLVVKICDFSHLEKE